MNEETALSAVSVNLVAVKGQCRHSLSLHASEDSAGNKKNNPAYLNSSVTYFPLLTCFVMIFSHGKTIVSETVFTPSRWNQSEQCVQQNAVAHFRRGEPSNFEPCADRTVIARVAGGNSRLNVLMDVVARPSANRVLIDGERDHLLSDRRLRLAKSDAFLAYN